MRENHPKDRLEWVRTESIATNIEPRFSVDIQPTAIANTTIVQLSVRKDQNGKHIFHLFTNEGEK